MKFLDIFAMNIIGNALDLRPIFSKMLSKQFCLFMAVISVVILIMNHGETIIMAHSILFAVLFSVLYFVSSKIAFDKLKYIVSVLSLVEYILFSITFLIDHGTADTGFMFGVMMSSSIAVAYTALCYKRFVAIFVSALFVAAQVFIAYMVDKSNVFFSSTMFVAMSVFSLFCILSYDYLIIKMVNYYLDVKKEYDKNLVEKREFITKLSHKIRTPLSNILGIGNILYEKQTDENRQLLESLVASVKNITDIVELIDGESVAAPVYSVNKKDIVEFDLRELISKSAEVTKGIEVKLNVVGELPRFKANVVRIRRIFLGIFDFFVKYSNDQSSVNLTITVNKVRIPSSPTKYRFDISTPIVIPLDSEDNIEELELTNRLIESLQGNMKRRFDDESSFIYFNIALDEVGESSDSASKKLEVYTSESEGFIGVSKIKDLSKAKILICEDNTINQKVMTLSLEKYVDVIDIAFNGQEGVNLYQKNNYDIIVMDIQMPVLDGYEATKKIREIELENKKHVPIIAITANTLSGDRDHCFMVGMDDYVSKPFNLNVVISKMRELLNKYPQS